MPIEIEQRPRKRLATVRHLGPYNQIGGAFAQLGAIAGRSGLFVPGVEMIGVYHDSPQTVAPSELRSDAAVTVDDGVAIPPGLTEGELPAGRYACVRHRGSYETLGAAWQSFMSELATGGHRFGRGPTFEVYRESPMMTPGVEPLTELYAPVE